MHAATHARRSIWIRWLAGLAAVAMVALLFAAFSKPAHAAVSSFVNRCGIHFCVDGQVSYFAGANSYDLFTYGSGSGDTETQYMDKSAIDAQFANMQADGVNLVRTWMFSHESWHGFEPTRGVMNEQEWDEFDYILYSAGQHGIRVIPTFENYWSAYGGIGTILNWNGLSSGDPANGAFFDPTTCSGCLKDYLYEVDYALNRVNHYTGVAYKDDPTVFAWELMNEPRHQNQTPNDNTTGTVFNSWVDSVGANIRSIDTNHMITTGIEGQGTDYGYGSDNGVPFVATCENQYVDFCSAHVYPTESWANLSVAQTQTLIGRYISDAHDVVGKPMFLGEFNVDSSDRSTYWPAIYSTIEQDDGDASAFWWYENSGKDGTYGVLHGDPVLSVFHDYANAMSTKSGSPSTTPTGWSTPTGTPTPTSTPTDTSTPSTTPTPTPSSGTGSGSTSPGACAVQYHLDDWGSSFNGNVTILNEGTSTINGWTLTFTFLGAQTVNSAWNANWTQSGQTVTASSPSWNSTISAGGSTSFGMNGSSSGTNGTPTNFVLNGQACTVSAD